MNKHFDLVVRGGAVVDGSGGAIFDADVGVRDGRIAAVGKGLDAGQEEIDARGLLVTPGFVDIHTHYDGQATWDSRFSPSSDHGVTTVVAGNCGVGFAPCRKEQRKRLIEVMEGVEDIPELVMAEGLPWTWETFPDYLDILSKRAFDMDFAVHLAHSPLRLYVMGDRGSDAEATDEELATMRRLTAEAVRAGAIGISSSRYDGHHDKHGQLPPGVLAADPEMLSLAAGLRDAGRGVFQMIGHTYDPEGSVQIIRQIAEASGRPVSFTLLQASRCPEGWRTYTEALRAAADDGLQIRGQVLARPIGALLGLQCTLNPFSLHPSYQAIASLPLEDKVKALQAPDMRARLLAEQPEKGNPDGVLMLVGAIDRMYPFGSEPEYEPSADASLTAIAARRGVSPYEVAYDLLLEDDGKAILYLPFSNFIDNRIDVVRGLMADPNTILGLGDGGAHCGVSCDASYPTYVLTRWVRDADPQDAFTLPWAIKALANDTAAAVGLTDRGIIKPGLRANLNILDYDKLKLHAPTITHDLPAGGRRLRQRADGYVATIVSGQVTYRNGEPTGALPGQLIRAAAI
jgi:N-acyl-D-aspartate/D-glutamate deacylase